MIEKKSLIDGSFFRYAVMKIEKPETVIVGFVKPMVCILVAKWWRREEVISHSET